MSNETGVGSISLHENMYFTCSSGLVPAKIQSTQSVVKTEESYHYLVSDDTACSSIGDFMCRWTVVLAAAVVAVGVITGGAALAVLAVGVGASAALCGWLMAPKRAWKHSSEYNSYGRKGAFSLTSKCQMTCPIGGVITYAPGITSTWKAIVYSARNFGWAIFEGVMVGTFLRLGTKAFAGSATPLMTTAIANWVFLQISARTIGIADQVFIEGMLRNGKKISETGDEVIAGATMLEQPIYNLGNKITGTNTSPLVWHDYYYATIGLLGHRAMYKSAMTNPNLTSGMIRQSRQLANRLRRGRLFERIRLEERYNLTSIYDNPVWRALWEQAKENKRNTGRENQFTRYENGMRGEVPGRARRTSYEREAFSLLETEFRRLAAEAGVQVPDGPVHHGSWSIEQFSDHATDPKNLYPTESAAQHRQIHRETSQGPHPTRDPVSPIHEKPLYEYRPVPIDDNDLD